MELIERIKNIKLIKFNENDVVFLRFFCILFFIFFLLFNWNDVSWALNYQFLGSVFSGLSQSLALESSEVLQRKQEMFIEKIRCSICDKLSSDKTDQTEEENQSENELEEGDKEMPQENLYEYTEKENGIYIPKIHIEAPLVFPLSNTQKDINSALKKGVIHYPGSVLPGEIGQTIILGHSAGPSWPKIYYDWVFSKLNKLEPGDSVDVYFENKRFVYTVKERIYLDPGQEIPESELTNSESVLILLSCWPPGSSQGRIAVKAIISD